MGVKLVRSSNQRMLKMGLLNFCSFMADTQQRFQTFHGTPMNPGSSAQCQRTTLCKSGKWLKIFIMMKRLISLLESWSRLLHEHCHVLLCSFFILEKKKKDLVYVQICFLLL